MFGLNGMDCTPDGSSREDRGVLRIPPESGFEMLAAELANLASNGK